MQREKDRAAQEHLESRKKVLAHHQDRTGYNPLNGQPSYIAQSLGDIGGSGSVDLQQQRGGKVRIDKDREIHERTLAKERRDEEIRRERCKVIENGGLVRNPGRESAKDLIFGGSSAKNY